MITHEQLVADFFRRAEHENPEGYRAVCDQHQVMSRRTIGRKRSVEYPLEWAENLFADDV